MHSDLLPTPPAVQFLLSLTRERRQLRRPVLDVKGTSSAHAPRLFKGVAEVGQNPQGEQV